MYFCIKDAYNPATTKPTVFIYLFIYFGFETSFTFCCLEGSEALASLPPSVQALQNQAVGAAYYH